MARPSWITLLLLILLQICHANDRWPGNDNINNINPAYLSTTRDCYTQKRTFIVADNFYGNISAQWWNRSGDYCTVFVQTNGNKIQNYSSDIQKLWPEISNYGTSYLLYISKWHTNYNMSMYVLRGKQCNSKYLEITDSSCNFSYTNTDPCQITCVRTKTVCQNATYNENYCINTAPSVKDYYIINLTQTTTNCMNCDNPVKQPEENIPINTTLVGDGGKISGAKAAELMKDMKNLVANMTGSSAAISVGNVTGVLVRETQIGDVQDVFFGYKSPNDSINIIENSETLKGFSRSVTVPKEAFDKAISSNITIPFVALFRFSNLAKDQKNSTVLGDEIIAVEMGAGIANLTDKININFKNTTYKGIPSCQSWNGEGGQPNWTSDGCQTNQTGDGIVCQCSHLTFFAILLSPLNETIPPDDFNRLTIITQVSCGLSMFFLAVVLFMHFLLRRTKASYTTKILINLVFALFLLNLTFLVNNYVAKLRNAVGCKIMAVLMHYFLLATFTWFAAQAFHLCLNLYKGGKIAIHRYLLKIAITSWVLPSVIGIVLLSIGKYGEQVIHTQNNGNPNDDVVMCWITDNSVYIVNIGYYALVFIITFTTFIIIVSWLCRLRNAKGVNVEGGQNSRGIISVLGLCFMLGITWGFAFFAYGAFQIPAYYIFTILNSLQGFFLFIFYYKTTRTAPAADQKSTSVYSNTLETSIDNVKNPYDWMESK